ncbi:hypothetical protein J437_LFUL017098 [Ladona fulva]|uniref:Uncharacterized protein n=1 Tax=Ladona fulva TaxID=123851 RepID=A0A8K0KGR0_LADFU|nr:hypothetical protein J437_LFUL017098 [Ladona fulva]
MAASNNGHLPNSLEDGEDKPMLIVKKAGDGPGITALINRQLQAFWFMRDCYEEGGGGYEDNDLKTTFSMSSKTGKQIRLSVYDLKMINLKKFIPRLTLNSALRMPRIRYYYCATDPNAWRLGRIEEADHETPV